MLLRFVLSLSILLSVVSCGQSKTQSGKNPAEDTPSPFNQAENPKPLKERFPIFDVSYDYNPADRFTPNQLAENYPVWNNEAQNQVAFLKAGEEFFAARMQFLEKATKSVRIQALYIRNDEASNLLGDKLLELVKKGIVVKMIIDPFSVISPKDQSLLFRLKRGGIEIEGYEFAYFNFLLSIANPANLLAKVEELNRRYHEKMFIVDGEIPDKALAIIGGTNIANHYFRFDRRDPHFVWMDRDIAMKGPVVGDILRQFEANMSEFQSRRTSLGSKFMDNIWDFLREHFPPKDETKAYERLNENIVLTAKKIAENPLQLNWHNTQVRIIHNRPRANEDLISTAYIEVINKAQSSVDIVNAFYMPDNDILNALKQAAARGVKVRIITNHEKALSWISAGTVMTTVARSFYFQTLDSSPNISIFEFASDDLLKNGEGQLHSKYMVVDGEVSVVGSYNLDPRGRDLNSENIGIFGSKDFANELLVEVNDLASAKNSVPVSIEDAKKYKQNFQDGGYRTKILDILTPYL